MIMFMDCVYGVFDGLGKPVLQVKTVVIYIANSVTNSTVIKIGSYHQSPFENNA